MKIACGSDLSKASESALRASIALAKRLPVTELWVVHIIDATSGASNLANGERDAIQTIKTQLAAIDATSELEGRCEIHATACPADERSVDHALRHFARAHGADLLVVSSQGHSASPLVRLGGMSERVAHAADLPVLVVRDPAPFEAWARKGRRLRVLLGTDGNRRTQPALELAERLRAAGDCDLVLGRVYDVTEAARDYGLPRPADWLARDPQIEALIARDLAREFDPSGQDPTGVRYRPIVGLGRRGDHLLDLAERETIDLVIVGSHPMAWFDRLSSVGSVVLHFGHASVACVPTGPGHSPDEIPKLERVLAATDLSDHGNEAIRYAFGLLGATPGQVFLTHVVPTEWSNERDTAVAGLLRDRVPREAAGRNVAIRTEIVHSDRIAEAIVSAARRLGVDAICMGSRGRSAVKSAVLGSVAEAVIQHADQPVFVVRAPK